jgi:hypothetical protein
LESCRGEFAALTAIRSGVAHTVEMSFAAVDDAIGGFLFFMDSASSEFDMFSPAGMSIAVLTMASLLTDSGRTDGSASILNFRNNRIYAEG